MFGKMKQFLGFVGIEVHGIDAVHGAWRADHILAPQLRRSALVLLERQRVIPEPRHERA